MSVTWVSWQRSTSLAMSTVYFLEACRHYYLATTSPKHDYYSIIIIQYIPHADLQHESSSVGSAANDLHTQYGTPAQIPYPADRELALWVQGLARWEGWATSHPPPFHKTKNYAPKAISNSQGVQRACSHCACSGVFRLGAGAGL